MTTDSIKRTPTEVWDGGVEIYGDFTKVADLLDIDLTLGQGKRRDEFHWKNKTAPLGAFLSKITKHEVSASKDGPCFTQGSIVGERRKAVAMDKMDLLVLDMDTGQSIAEVRERILQEGLFAVIYTTHSNGSTKSSVSKAVFFKKMKLDDDDEITDQLCATYLEVFKRYTPEIAKTARFNKVEHTPDGIQIFIDHAPMQKYRIVFLLDEPYVFAEESANQTKAIDKWKKKYAGVANMLDAFYDQSCVDPSRLFYYPTHGKDKEYHVEIIVGDTLVLDDIEDADPRNMKVSENAFLDDAGEGSDGEDGYVWQTDWVRAWYKRHGERFAAADFLRDYFSDDIRDDTGIKVTTVCPFDDNHTKAGDPEDKGFFGSNAGEWEINGEPGKLGLMKCSHSSCKEHTSAHFLDQLVAQDVISGPEDLEDFLFELEGDEDDEESASESGDDTKAQDKEKPKKDDTPPWDDVKASPEVAALLKAIAKLTPVSDIHEILDDIVAEGLNDSEHALLVKAIASATKRTMSEVGKALRGKLADEQRRLTEEKDKSDGITAVYTNEHFTDQVKKIIAALKKAGEKRDNTLFKTEDGHLARVSTVTGTGTARLEMLDKSQLFVALTDIVQFRDEAPGGRFRVAPAPNDIVQYFTGIDPQKIPLPTIKRVVKHPIFTEEGRFVSKSGFDLETGAYIDIPFKMPPVNGSPSDRELDKAYGLIFDDLFVDFPFQDGEDMNGTASKANLLAMLMQPFIRDIIGTAATPMYVVNKPVAGAGSGKLVDCVSIVQTGEAVQTSQFGANEEENAKVITSRLKSDPASILFFDNVNVKVTSGSLASAITSGMYSARLLSTNDEIKVQMQGIWAMSGIAMTFSTELARRVAPVWLVPAEAKPEDRSNFKHNDILQWAADHRPELVWAVCTLVQAWIDDGMPTWSKPPIGSFERWSRNVGGVMESIGVDGFMENAGDFRRDTSYESDADQDFIIHLFEDNVTTLGKVWTTGEVFDGLWDDQDGLEISLPKVNGRNKNGAKASFGLYVKTLLGRKFEVFDKEGEKRVVFIQRRGRKDASNVNAFFLDEVQRKA